MTVQVRLDTHIGNEPETRKLFPKRSVFKSLVIVPTPRKQIQDLGMGATAQEAQVAETFQRGLEVQETVAESVRGTRCDHVLVGRRDGETYGFGVGEACRRSNRRVDGGVIEITT